EFGEGHALLLGQGDLRCGGVKTYWMCKRFIDYIANKPVHWAPAPEHEDQYVRGFLFYLVGMTFFRTADSSIPLGWMAGVRGIAEVGRYDWGSAALAHLYLGFDEASRNVKNVGGLGGLRGDGLVSHNRDIGRPQVEVMGANAIMWRPWRDDPHLTADLETRDPLAVYGERFRAHVAAAREAEALSRRRVVFLSSKVRA
ncbi:hypothetical protein FRX31_003070, partial [Thalictrum thalictroides]